MTISIKIRVYIKTLLTYIKWVQSSEDPIYLVQHQCKSQERQEENE